MLVDDISVTEEVARLTGGTVSLVASAPEELRARAGALGRRAAQKVLLRKDELHDDAALGFRRAAEVRIAYAALELRAPGDTAKLMLATVHAIAAGLAFTLTASATISYLLATR